MSWSPGDDYDDCNGLVCCMCGCGDKILQNNPNDIKLKIGWCHYCRDYSVLITLAEFEKHGLLFKALSKIRG